jgi:hypothetical protein
MSQESRKIFISNQGLSRVGGNEENDFTFVVGSNEYHCSRFQARFISERVCRLQSIDCTINRLENEDIEDSDKYFEEICSIYKGGSFEITRSNVLPLLEIVEWLCNSEVVSKLIEFKIGAEPLRISNVIDRLLLKSKNFQDISIEIEFISSRFSCFDIESFGRLDSSHFERIVSSTSLRIDSEDLFEEMILSLGFIECLGYVDCRYLSPSGIDRLLNSISLSSMNSQIWDSICARLRCNIVDLENDIPRFSRIFGFDNSPFSGILSYLTSNCGGNVHECGIVEITCSSTGRNQCWQVANHGWSDYWASKTEANSWIRFDFKNRRLLLEHYTLKSPSSGCYCTDWVVEGLDEGSEWTKIDERHTDDVIGRDVIHTFSCRATATFGGFRLIRWRMTDKGKDKPGSDRCCHSAKMCNVEFFGILSRSPFQ